ncbi:MAG: 50S ribosomal protein L4 [Thermoplasmata archaeon]|uniref:Large ribosomal subunit protein uL4 n=1 Tax=Candidatus Sysuiplasma superficiale TaxID=2823368 RepID=A0A8J7YPF2_9ARCH|nr:50S ribosomal protein L4 [Candidatus Sysuiplasma superficiale]MBX8644328.1 50S ribosomal protein L4 [Candidatus Sysuiplasma superficiale]MCL4347082.1 50S ribosomal protein L4 [Candidatus Thermoplasmatota archaeon]
MAEKELQKEEEVLKEGHVFVYSRDGNPQEQLPLPPVFVTPFRPDIIRKDFAAASSRRRQPYGPAFRAGMRHSVETWGKGRGVARVQRIKGQSTAAESPNNVGGRRAHPPRPWKNWRLRINEKERRLARMSALAATSKPEIVKSRGHRFPEGVSLPIVVDDEVENMKKSADFEQLLGSIGIAEDVVRVREGRHVRAGRGKMRNRRYRQPVGPLVVVSAADAALAKSAKNLAGVDVVTASSLNTECLAPGGNAGRLVIFSKRAFESLRGV